MRPLTAGGRVAWLPFLSTDGGRLFHLGANLRYGHPNEGTLKLRSRPESFPSPYFVDTGEVIRSFTVAKSRRRGCSPARPVRTTRAVDSSIKCRQRARCSMAGRRLGACRPCVVYRSRQRPLRGGRFWRLTPMVNWYLSDRVRLEMTYGYGALDRFSLEGKTHFFQTRLQLQL